MDIDPGTVVANRYRISRPLGRGGMGEVFAAENIRTGRPVAVKLLRSDSKSKSSAMARFKQEARAAGAINSDHVTQVLDVEEDSEHGVVLVFELLEGESLIDRLKRTGPIPFEELHPIIEQVWMGLADAHRVGIIHRDLKPSNVFLERRPDGTTRVKILDFGISKVPKEMGGETLTEMGQSLGTFSFMPPEQIGKAKTVDHRADIYACATMIYQSLTGQLPYSARNILVMVEMKSKSDARKLAEAMGGPVDPRLEAFVAQGLARDAAHRFQTAVEALAVWRELRPQTRSSTMEPVASSKRPADSQKPPRSAPPQQQQPPPPSEAPRSPGYPSTVRSAQQVDADSAATVAMPVPHFAEAAPPEAPPRIDPRMSASMGPRSSVNLGPASSAPRGVGGTQPVRMLRPVTPVSPTAQAAGVRATGTGMPVPVVPGPRSSPVPTEKPPSERSGNPSVHDDPRGQLASGLYPQAGQGQPPSSNAPPPNSGPRSPLPPTPASGLAPVPRVFEENTSVPASSSEGATQVYRPRAADAARLAKADSAASSLNLPAPTPAVQPKRSSPWTFLLGAIAFLLVGFFIVAAIMRYLAPGPR